MMRRFLILLLLALSLPTQAGASEHDPNLEVARLHFLQQIDTLQQAMQTLDADVDPGRFDRIRDTIRILGDAELSLLAHVMATGRSQEPAPEAIEFPEPDIPYPCDSVTPELGFGLFLIAADLREILAFSKWLCLESVGGENAAAGCVVANIAKVTAEFVFEGAELCLAIQRSANQIATLETEKNVAEHLNEFVTVKVSSRASQNSMDDLQADVTQELSDLNDLAGSLAADVSDLGADLTDISTSISTGIASLAAATIDMTSVSEDIRLKTLATHAEILEADELAADTQQRLEIVRNHSQQIAASVQTLESLINGLNIAADAAIERELDASLGRAMSDPNYNIIRYKLPASKDGELERSREVLVRAMLAFDGIGVDTTMAAQLLTMGDAQFNAGRYLSAYDNYSQAYQLLVQQSGPMSKNP